MSRGLDIATSSKEVHDRCIGWASWFGIPSPQLTGRKGYILNQESSFSSLFLFSGRDSGHAVPGYGCGGESPRIDRAARHSVGPWERSYRSWSEIDNNSRLRSKRRDRSVLDARGSTGCWQSSRKDDRSENVEVRCVLLGDQKSVFRVPHHRFWRTRRDGHSGSRLPPEWRVT